MKSKSSIPQIALPEKSYVLVRATHGMPKLRAMTSEMNTHLADSIEQMHHPICGASLGAVGWEFTADQLLWPNPDLEKGKRHLCANCYRVANARMTYEKAPRGP